MNNSCPDIPYDLSDLDAYIAEWESQYNLKEDTAAKIVWANPENPQKTDYAIVYLHGFRASHQEGDPVHKKVAESLGYNLFLSRLAEHGEKSTYPLLDLTVEKLLESARFAFEIGRRIGKKIILMGTSTGASLSLYLASKEEYQTDISSLILYSPLIRFYGLKEKALMYAPLRTLLRMMLGKKHLVKTAPMTFAEIRIWDKHYALAGALALGSFVDRYMRKKLFKKVRSPAFIGYYCKNNQNQDTVVSVPAIKWMTGNLGSRTEWVRAINFPDAKSHVISSSLVSKATDNVIVHTKRFLKSFASQETRDLR